ncbi:DUF2169 domain-containing protein [Pendulispora brunnea]|uniref:DUF2169 domain-containing protein n=1 Tax=Pendulispora brunnea TaxID=2905690 RepID=A0ABZ2JYS3_9BACT
MTQGPLLSLLDYTDAPNDTSILHVFAKRTYTFAPGHRPIVAPLQVPLHLDAEYHPPTGQGDEGAPRTDCDIFCLRKAGTDVVVQGSAHSTKGPVPCMDVGVSILGTREPERAGRRIRVTGDRHAEYRGNGNHVVFSPPESFEKMPLTYARAYGGCDLWSAADHPDEMGDWLAKHSAFSGSELSLYRYPRNPAGRGFLVHPSRAAFDALMLPNLEFPEDMLTPSRLCTGDLYRWPTAPFPAGFDWFDTSWFPRLAFLLATSTPHRCDPADFSEVRGGVVPRELVASTSVQGESGSNAGAAGRDRFYHGASPWLAVAPLSGRETIVLWGMHPLAPRLDVPLPAETPQVLFELPNGRVIESEASLRTVVVRPDDGQLTTVWVARHWAGQALTPAQAVRIRHAVRWRARSS